MVKQARMGLKSMLAAIVAAGAVIMVCAQPAQAQMGAEWQEMMNPPVNSREIDQFAKTLVLDDAQEDMVDDLFDAMSAEFERMSEIMRDMVRQAQAEAHESGGRGGNMWADIGKKMERFEEKKEDMQEQFFSDMKLLLTEEQLERWPAAERRWYRGRKLGDQRFGFLSAMRADVALLVEEVELSAEETEEVSPIVEQYERAVDRELHEFDDLLDEQRDAWNEIRDSGNWLASMDKMNELFAELRDKLVVVRNLNGKYRDQIALRLEGESHDKFVKAYDKAAFPALYKDSYVDSGIRTVLEMPDLTTDQRDEVIALQDRYRAELAALNKKLEKAMLESDATIKMTDFWNPGPGGEKAELEGQKKTLQEERFAQLKALLNEEQAAKLPDQEGDDWRDTEFDF